MEKKKYLIVFCAAAAAQAIAVHSATAAPAAAAPGPSPPPAYKVSGPFPSNNLSVYLIHGKEKLQGQKILTLEEALRAKQVIVEETSNVNQLRVKNLSGTVVFLQSGDIVRGGKQDRAVQYDLLLAPKQGFVPLPVFCVEHDRWQQRAGEVAGSFAVSDNQLVGKELKLAAKRSGDQSAVWQGVANYQSKMSQKVKSNVCSSLSPSSLELTMEHEKVKTATNEHLKKLAKVVDGQSDVIGYAFAVNGKLNSADVYASSDLFRRLWPKLLKSTAAEAVADQEKSAQTTTPSAKDVLKFLADEPAKKAVNKLQSKESEMSEQEDSKTLLYKTRWYNAPRRIQVTGSSPSIHDMRDSDVIHSNYIAK